MASPATSLPPVSWDLYLMITIVFTLSCVYIPQTTCSTMDCFAILINFISHDHNHIHLPVCVYPTADLHSIMDFFAILIYFRYKNLTIIDTGYGVKWAHKPYTVSNLSHEGQLQRCLESEVGSESRKPNGGSSSYSTRGWSIISASSKGHVLGNINASTSRNCTPMIHTSSGAT